MEKFCMRLENDPQMWGILPPPSFYPRTKPLGSETLILGGTHFLVTAANCIGEFTGSGWIFSPGIGLVAHCRQTDEKYYRSKPKAFPESGLGKSIVDFRLVYYHIPAKSPIEWFNKKWLKRNEERQLVFKKQSGW
ncbi:MAG: hypothetical protein ACLFWL_19100 [Candidatus Brocadiia bacterium]